MQTMQPVSTLSLSDSRHWRYIEWVLIAIALCLGIFQAILLGNWQWFGVSLLLLLIFLRLSFIFPIHRSLWIRQGYITLGICVALLGRAFLLVPLDLFLYLYLGKACFLLKQKYLILTILLSGMAVISFDIFLLEPILKILYREFSSSRHDFTLAIADSTTNFVAAGSFAILFSFALVDAQKNQRKAEQLATQVETLAADLERHRIAREIHDSLGHTLTALNVHLAVAQRLYGQNLSTSITQVQQSLNTAKLLSDQCLEEINQTLRTMRQSNFDLNQTLTALVEHIRQDRALQVHWDFNIPPVPLSISHHIYCIVKEGLMNIQKHAHATRIQVRGYLQVKDTAQTEDAIMIELQDNGQGFDPIAPTLGFGLQGMQERSHLIGGHLMIQSKPGKGTQIQVIIPQQ
jgi:signal transduction histidine kinase